MCLRVRKNTFYLKFIIRGGSKGATRQNLQSQPKILKKLNQLEPIFPKKEP
jgi:hypothetical protein